MKAAEPLGYEIELIMVNDGSPDDSVDCALLLHRADPRLIVVDLARNFGHHPAMMTALSYATGDLVFLLDSDLEEEPELLPHFVERWKKGDCDVVYGVQEFRRGGLLERTAGACFFTLLNRLSDVPIPRNLVTARLMTRDYVRALVRHRDREFLMAQLWQLTGFRQVPFEIQKLSRSASTYSLRRRIEMAVKQITTTSTKLLYMILYLGIAICVLSLVAVVFYIFRYLYSGIGVDGFTSLIVSIWFFGGLTTLILGVLGIYLATIFSETKRRPYTVVRKVYRVDGASIDRSNVIRGPGSTHLLDAGGHR
jgi:putative glycosyltransferase